MSWGDLRAETQAAKQRSGERAERNNTTKTWSHQELDWSRRGSKKLPTEEIKQGLEVQDIGFVFFFSIGITELHQIAPESMKMLLLDIFGGRSLKRNTWGWMGFQDILRKCQPASGVDFIDGGMRSLFLAFPQGDVIQQWYPSLDDHQHNWWSLLKIQAPGLSPGLA